MTGKKKANILIVDDVPANVMTLKVVLESEKYELFEAHSGFEAIKSCDEHEFALVVLDVQMPEMDGFETARRIKQSKLNKDVPIFFITAVFHEDPFIKKGYSVGAIDYFGKPFDPEILKAKVGIYTELYLKTKSIEETEKLLKSHSQIKSLLEAIPIGIVVANLDGEIYEFNEEANKIWGGSREAFVEKCEKRQGWCNETKRQLEYAEWPLNQTLKTGKVCNQKHMLIKTFEGEMKEVSISAYPIKNESGELLGGISIIKDVSAQAELANNIHKAVGILGDTKSQPPTL